jgi:AmpD protein
MITSLLVGVTLQLNIVNMPLPTKKVIRDSTKNYIVIHNDGTNMNARGTYNVLQRRRLSYHYFIDRNGRVYRFTDTKYVAKHAGVSYSDGLMSWNDFSIGICLQGMNGLVYTNKQYESLQKLIDELGKRYTDVPNHRLQFHSEIAFPWGRKHDPGETFDRTRIKMS